MIEDSISIMLSASGKKILELIIILFYLGFRGRSRSVDVKYGFEMFREFCAPLSSWRFHLIVK